MDVGYKVVCHDVDPIELHEQTVIGTEEKNANLIVRSTANEQLLYIDGASGGNEPIFLGITKSRGTQQNKLPVEPGDNLGGVQIYGRTKPGSSLGYGHDETPLNGAIQCFVSKDYNKQGAVANEMVIALSNNTDMSIKLKLDSNGNLITQGNITSGNLKITDTVVNEVGPIEKYVQVELDGNKYAMPLYRIST